MSHIYRCSSCRTRNTFPRALADYIRPRHCRNCGHGTFYIDKERLARKGCTCSGYHFPHRPGAGACETSPREVYHLARRQGDDHLDAQIEQALRTRGAVDTEPPF